MFFINKVRWNIVFVPFNSYQLLKSDGQLTFATCDDITKTIYINNQIYGKFLKKVLCHEITHAAMFSYDVNITAEQEELLADLIATYGSEITYITNEIFRKLKWESY